MKNVVSLLAVVVILAAAFWLPDGRLIVAAAALGLLLVQNQGVNFRDKYLWMCVNALVLTSQVIGGFFFRDLFYLLSGAVYFVGVVWFAGGKQAWTAYREARGQPRDGIIRFRSMDLLQLVFLLPKLQQPPVLTATCRTANGGRCTYLRYVVDAISLDCSAGQWVLEGHYSKDNIPLVMYVPYLKEGGVPLSYPSLQFMDILEKDVPWDKLRTNSTITMLKHSNTVIQTSQGDIKPGRCLLVGMDDQEGVVDGEFIGELQAVLWLHPSGAELVVIDVWAYAHAQQYVHILPEPFTEPVILAGQQRPKLSFEKLPKEERGIEKYKLKIVPPQGYQFGRSDELTSKSDLV